MDIIEKIGDTITEKGKVAADKAKEYGTSGFTGTNQYTLFV